MLKFCAPLIMPLIESKMGLSSDAIRENFNDKKDMADAVNKLKGSDNNSISIR